LHFRALSPLLWSKKGENHSNNTYYIEIILYNNGEKDGNTHLAWEAILVVRCWWVGEGEE
jgi:hypothetical protein